MKTRYERDIYLFLALYRFFSYGLAVILTEVVPLGAAEVPPLQTYTLLGMMGVYTLLKVLGPLRWWQRDPTTYVVLGGDLLVCVLILLLTGGLSSPFLLYSLAPILTAALVFAEGFAVGAAAITFLALAVAHLLLTRWYPSFAWIMQGNYLLWLIVYGVSSLLMASVVFRTNLNIRQRIEMGAITDERQRMRREIHDGVAQALSVLSLKADSVGKSILDQNTSKALASLDELRKTVAMAHQDIRESIDQLHIEVGVRPFVSVLGDYVTEFGEGNSLETHFDAPREVLRISRLAELQLLRIAQEALANIRRHAQATKVWVKVGNTPQAVELTVKDNGRGFPQSDSSGQGQGQGEGHHGLRVMRERAESLGGSLSVVSAPGQGTIIWVSLPGGKVRL